ncbi:MAG TPA: glycosyltransferase family 2 protein [Pyrinomonadaceae bacterium]|jgi:glycosyltransferase involved in cell wall biosynthesis
MRLDVIIPTYNRAELLGRALASLLEARVPEGLEARVTVVDNNSKDSTRETVRGWEARFGGRLGYVFEDAAQGRSPAVNAGVRATDGDLVGIIDDDEEVDAGWFECVHKVFSAGGADFIGGPCVPRWGAEAPAWFPDDYRGVVGWVDGGDRVIPFEEYPGILMGGNAVLTREVLGRVGLYSTELGRTDKALLSCEDEELYGRLQAAGARGFYRPDLIIHHYVPPERLTRKYFRRWCFWRGVSRGVIDRARPAPVVYLAGVPRFLFGRAARGALRTAGGALRPRGGDAARRFSDELAVWDLAGFFYGKHFYRAAGAAAQGGAAAAARGAG